MEGKIRECWVGFARPTLPIFYLTSAIPKEPLLFDGVPKCVTQAGKNRRGVFRLIVRPEACQQSRCLKGWSGNPSIQNSTARAPLFLIPGAGGGSADGRTKDGLSADPARIKSPAKHVSNPVQPPLGISGKPARRNAELPEAGPHR